MAARRDPIAFFARIKADHGDAVFFHWGNQPTWVFFHPDAVKELLVTQDRLFTKWFAVERTKELLGNGLFVSEGAYHHRQRKLAQPAFHHQRIKSYAGIVLETAQTLRDRWTDGEVVDVAQEMNWFALIAVARALFGADVDSEASEIRDALGGILDLFERAALPPDEQADFDMHMARLDATILRIIEERRRSPEDRGDLLSMLLAAHDEGDGSGMSDRQIRDEAMTIFLAGHETTATALTWAWHLLALHPEVEKALTGELQTVLKGREVAYDDLAQLVITERIVSETLRLYPPVWAMGRQAREAVKIGGWQLDPGDVAIVCPYLTQRDARFFPEPERFDLERWTDEAGAVRPKFAYFPFSGGSRSCLGEGFAWMEAMMCLAVLAGRWRLEMAEGHRVALQPQLTLRAKFGMKMRLCRKH